MRVQPFRTIYYAGIACLLWTALVLFSAYHQSGLVREKTADIARAEAETSYQKDMLYRKWSAGHGGVYVPTTHMQRVARAELGEMWRWHAVFWLIGMMTIAAGGNRMHRENMALRQSEGRFRQIAENLGRVLWLSTPDRQVLHYVSPAYEKIWGRSCDSLYANPASWWDAVVVEDREAVSGRARNKIIKEPYSLEYRILRPEGTVRWIRERGFPIKDYTRGDCGLAGIAEDITALKELEKQREDLTAMLRHDMKTPLTIISGNTEMLLADFRASLSPDAAGMLKATQASADFLTKMIDDMSTVFSLESSSIPLKRSDEDITDLLLEVKANTAELARSKGLTYTKDIQEGMPRVPVDRLYLLRAVTNLVVNAINYTPVGGSVTLGASVQGSGADRALVIFVTDTGPGIGGDEKARVFEMYYRSKTSKGHKGSGLGLPIVKAVAEAHGGRVDLLSEPGAGSMFRICLPLSGHSPAIAS